MRNILRIVAAERRFFILQEIAVVVMGLGKNWPRRCWQPAI